MLPLLSENIVLAGPIVRRVEARIASVWIALGEPRRVQLRLWVGRQNAANSTEPDFAGPPVDTIRVGDRLHIAVAYVERIPPAGAFAPGQTYSYNVVMSKAGGLSDDLQSVGLLQTRDAGQINGQRIKPHLALGYDNGMLPSFITPPASITDACFIHGSCRRSGADTPDALAWVDDFIRESIQSPASAQIPRPHQLFLTGDQIYADDVPPALLYMITQKGRELFGATENLPATFADPVTNARSWPCDLANFPAGLRQNVTKADAMLTSEDGDSHLLSLAEFCTMYLFVWSNEVWPDEFPMPAQIAALPPDPIPGIWRVHTGLGFNAGTGFKDEEDNSCGQAISSLTDFTRANVEKVAACFCKKLAGEHAANIRILTRLRDNLPKVRRGLANVATYMTTDDHEITDDWNLSPMWRDRVHTAPLGRTLVRNGLLAFALFQAWGNDPKAFEQGAPAPSPNQRLLAAIPGLLPTGVATPVPAVMNTIDALLGLTLPEPDPANVATWHFSVAGSGYVVLALDLRTKRGRSVRVGAPENLSPRAMEQQIPPPAAGTEVAIVISSLTVLGPPLIDALLGPLLYKIFDLTSNLNKVNLPGLDPDAIESWPNHEPSFEALLARLAPYQRVVLLSGDVHFSDSAAMTYFRRGATPSRFAQFTASAMKNLFKSEVRQAGQQFALLQYVIAAEIDVSRLGWWQSRPDLLNLPQDAFVPPALRRRLAESPVVVPTTGWPAGTSVRSGVTPDWAWRVHVVRDNRPDAERPPAVRPAPLWHGTPDVAPDLSGYRAVAQRHQLQLDNVNHDRQMIFASNLGVVRFHRQGDILTASQDVFAIHRPPFDVKPLPYTRHEIRLTPYPEEPSPWIPAPQFSDDQL